MNRRKMFGILTAPVAAANIPVQSEIKTELKPYSVFNYHAIYKAWGSEYMRKAFDIHGDIDSFTVRTLLNGDTDAVYGGRLGLISEVRTVEVRQAFADACLNGEVPGVWWE